MNHLELFRHLFPLVKVRVFEDEMIYHFKNRTTAKYFESLALQIILDNGLPLVARLEIWEVGGYMMDIKIRVAYAPEMEEVEI